MITVAFFLFFFLAKIDFIIVKHIFQVQELVYEIAKAQQVVQRQLNEAQNRQKSSHDGSFLSMLGEFVNSGLYICKCYYDNIALWVIIVRMNLKWISHPSFGLLRSLAKSCRCFR